ENRDRVFWSAGHKAPALYAALGLAGYFEIDNIVLLRKLFSGFEGHPNRFKLPGIESSSGSLGQGLGLAVGSALNAKMDKKGYKVYCILGDGELDEGSNWEAAMSASHYKLDNLIAIVDRNKLQIDGFTSDVMEIEPLVLKWKSFGWQVFECDGNNIEELIKTFNDTSKIRDKPCVIIADTIKGKSISYAENICSYHGICPRDGVSGKESLDTALKDIGCDDFNKSKVDMLIDKAADYQKRIDIKVGDAIPKYSRNYFWNCKDSMMVKMDATRNGFGTGIEKVGEDPKVVALGADITDSIKMNSFYQNHPERRNRFFSMGIAEANMTVVAAGFAKEGKIPFIGSYGVFITGRNWDQLRTTVCYNNFNVKIVDAHGGVSVGPDGATHQALEDISNLYYLPNIKISIPSDAVEAEKATISIKEIFGPAAIRLAREASPVISSKTTPFKFGQANIIRYRGKNHNFIDAFDTFLSSEYKSENENMSIIASGPVVAEAMRAAYILKEEYGIETRVINLHTIKPIDVSAIINCAKETAVIITVEEHQVGGIGNIIAGVISRNKDLNMPFLMDMVGINDRFGESGKPWELMKIFGLTAEFVAKRAIDLYKKSGLFHK
ncbi:MAG: transketolase, partial [Actinobacteria bacterium]|nr:transketolase [Actinomycetota bacterium]